ncbi:M15 family metallopeptidase [Planosporangium sp. 12N6]|uniref:M15 family metallopeptidase n=1 Tax=Planosporangium spinosum TaxID=3402278 RepID=UPI003CEB39BD
MRNRVRGRAVSGADQGAARSARTPASRVLAALLSAVAVACATAAAVPSAASAAPASVRATGADMGAGGRAPAGFVSLSDVDRTILQDIRYDTHHNFVGRPIVGYHEPLCILTRQAAQALRRVQAAARAEGYSLKVYDCYRPQRAVDDFVRWAQRLDDQRMKTEFYPQVDKTVLFDDGYIASRSGHSRGSTMDLTLVALPARAQRPYVPGEPLVACTEPQARRFPDNTVDMGTGYDCFDPLAHTLDPRVTGPAMDNRLLLKRLMEEAGFANYANEWWHYTLANEPYSDTYFDFPVARGAVTGD